MSLQRTLSAVAAVLVMSVAWNGPSYAQGSDIIRGRIVDPDSVPVEGARITVTSVVSAIERTTRTDRNGRFTVVFPGSDGHYVVSVSQIGYLLRTFELKRTADQAILVADATLQKVLMDAVVVTADVRGTIPRGSLTTDISGTAQTIAGSNLDPGQQGNLAAMASSLPGVLLIPGAGGGADGFSVLGLDPTDNSITLNGMTFDGGDLPRDAGLTSSLATSPYDVSRGGFSGGELAIRSGSGSNILRQGMSLNMVLPQLMWTDLASRARGNEQTALSFSGVASGPIKLNSSFYSVSGQFDRRTNPLQTLLNSGAFGLQSDGVAFDSVTRMLGALNSLGLPATAGGSASTVANERGSFLGTFNFNPPTSTTGAQYSVTVNGSWNRSTPMGIGLRSVPAYGGERSGTSASITARHTAYLKIFLSETSVGASHSNNKSEPFLSLPAGQVRVTSEFGDGNSAIRDLSFGGNPGMNSRSESRGATLNNSLSWFSVNNKHRLRLTTELRYSGSSAEQGNNLLGMFRFNSLSDLEAGIPSSFSRQLTTRRDESSQLTTAVSLGDSYRHSNDLQFQYGVRLDGGKYFIRPEYNPAVESAFGVRNDFVPSRLYVTPRVGFSWTLGAAPELSAFDGAVRGPRAVLRGGVAVQQNAMGSINSVVNNTGLPNAIRMLNCVGPAAPLPEWELYQNDPGAIPDQCADGSQGTVFASSAPGVTLYSRDYRAPRSVRSNLSWTGTVLDNRFGLTLSATHSLNLNRGSQVDLNFDPTVRFTLDSEGGRPVFVQTGSIVPTTGAIAARDARVSQSFSRVNELRSDLRSETVQLQVNLNPRITSITNPFRWSASYTYQDVREQQRGFSSTVGNPLEVYWSRGSSTARHQIGYSLSYSFFRLATVRWNGRINSGRPYTPLISGDVNGDGMSNDRPFIFDPASTADASLASAMEQLLQSTSRDARRCLMRQLGELARRNSCESGWSMTGDLSINIDAARLRLPRRAQLTFNFVNPMAGADLLVNGSRNPKGWGQSSIDQIDPTLLYVRGFDPATNTFKYEVNQRFGSPRQAFRSNTVQTGMTAMLSIDLGPVRERQTITRSLRAGRTMPGTKMSASALRSNGSASVPNPITSVLRLQDSLQMSAAQADSLATLNRRYTIQIDSIWDVASSYLAELPDDFRESDAWQRYLDARRAAIDLLAIVGPQVKGILTPAQMRKLPASLHNAMDPRYLVAVRNGNGIYVPAASGLAGGSSSEFFAFEAMSPAVTIVR